jgi:glycosyltransferase involved in cell wall biosynthesis
MPVGLECINGVVVRRFKVFNGLQGVRRILAQGFHRLNLPYNDWLRTIQNGPLIRGMSEAVACSDTQVVFATAFPFLHMYYALTGARRGNIPIVLLGAIHLPNRWDYERKMMYQAIHQANAYIAHTTAERDHLIQRGIRREKISVIGCGADVDAFFWADGAKLRQQYGWGNDPVVGVVGRQSVLKRWDIILGAMPKVWTVLPNTRLLLAGARTSYSVQIEQMINTLAPRHQSRTTMINDFAENEKPNLLAACDLLVLPSANESFGTVFVEAWACGKPVVGARAGAIPSVIDDGRDGLLFRYPDPDSMAEAIVDLLTHPSKAKRMGQAGRKKVLENYTWEIVADRLRNVYSDVARG